MLSVIIPAYNEEKRIANVLMQLLNSRIADEIIVIDDGSTDNTADVVRKFSGVILLQNEVNIGKLHSVQRGFHISQGDYTLLLDADFMTISSDDIANLVNPVLDCSVDVAIANVFHEKLWRERLIFLSGQRCFSRYAFHAFFSDLKGGGYSLEVLMNDFIIRNQLGVCIVDWNNVDLFWKYNKVGWIRSLGQDLSMYFDIFSSIGVYKFLQQSVLFSNCLECA